MSRDVPERIKVLWSLGTTEGGRAVDLPYLTQVAKAADTLGYYGVLLPARRAARLSGPRRAHP